MPGRSCAIPPSCELLVLGHGCSLLRNASLASSGVGMRPSRIIRLASRIAACWSGSSPWMCSTWARHRLTPSSMHHRHPDGDHSTEAHNCPATVNCKWRAGPLEPDLDHAVRVGRRRRQNEVVPVDNGCFRFLINWLCYFLCPSVDEVLRRYIPTQHTHTPVKPPFFRA